MECDPVIQKAIPECALPQTYTEVRAFLGLVGHYRRFIKRFEHIAQPLNEHSAGRSQQEVRVGVTFRGCLEGFQGIQTGCMTPNCSCWRLMYERMD